MSVNKNYLKKLKEEAQQVKRTLPKDYRYDYECYEDGFFNGFFPELSIEECMELAKREHIVNDSDLLLYVGGKIFKT